MQVLSETSVNFDQPSFSS